MSNEIIKQALAPTAVTLTTTPVASTNTVFVGHYRRHSLDMEYTPGAANNVLTVTIEKAMVDS